MTKVPEPGSALRFIRFKVQHDCAFAKLSTEFPTVSISAWSNHTMQVLQVSCDRNTWRRFEARAAEILRVRLAMPSRDGGVVVAHDSGNPKDSISRILESHDCLWMQPMILQDGWEEYETIAYGPGAEPEASAIAALRKQGVVRVVERQAIGSDELLESFFLPMRTVLNAATPKQAEALVAACQGGYYATPRRTTTAEIAKGMGLGRTSYEERLRGGENNILRILGPLLSQHRFKEDET